MESLNISGNKKTPEIAFEPFSGLLVIKGKSNLENPSKFYDPVINWLENYAQDPAIKTTFRMEMDYFNSSSAKHLMRVFRVLESIAKNDKKEVIVQWCHDDHDHSMQESGEDYSSMLQLNFEYVELE